MSEKVEIEVFFSGFWIFFLSKLTKNKKCCAAQHQVHKHTNWSHIACVHSSSQLSKMCTQKPKIFIFFIFILAILSDLACFIDPAFFWVFFHPIQVLFNFFIESFFFAFFSFLCCYARQVGVELFFWLSTLLGCWGLSCLGLCCWGYLFWARRVNNANNNKKMRLF